MTFKIKPTLSSTGRSLFEVYREIELLTRGKTKKEPLWDYLGTFPTELQAREYIDTYKQLPPEILIK